MPKFEAKDYVRVDGPGQQTITSLAYWLTPEGINPLTAQLVQKAIDGDDDAEFAEAFDGASKDEARAFLAKWELCFMPYWSADEVANAIAISSNARSGATALRATALAQQAGELPQAFTPRQGIEWAMARGYMFDGEICRFVGVQPGQYGHPHNPFVDPVLAPPSAAGTSEMPALGASVSAPPVALTFKQRRDALDMSRERGARRRILELWDAIEAEYGPAADAHQVARVLKRDDDEDEPSLKTVQNRLSELRKAGLIP